MSLGVIKRQAITPVAAPLCNALHAACFHPRDVWDIDFFTKLLALSTTRGEFLLVDDTPAAFLLWQHKPDGAEVYTLAVLPTHQRQGLARHLLQLAENALREDKIERMILDVAVDNTAALALYVACGYTEIARRAGYYSRIPQPAVDAIVMQKIIT